MFVPFITNRLERRKGGGGKGKGGSSSSGTGTKPTSSKGGKKKKKTVPLTTSWGQLSASAYGWGGGRSFVIPKGRLFAGRQAGGGTRDQIWGTRTYGSGYPGYTGRGVSRRGLPFYYWPVVWGVYPAPLYLQPFDYGNPWNISRVGGLLREAIFISNSTGTTFQVLSDNSTISSLISSIYANCSSSLSSSSSTSPQIYNTSAPDPPRPDQVIQYYRASSIVLTLDGYNNSAALSDDDNAVDTPLPSGIDMTLLDCMNQTIGAGAPLVDGAGSRWSTVPSSGSVLGLVCFIWWIFSL